MSTRLAPRLLLLLFLFLYVSVSVSDGSLSFPTWAGYVFLLLSVFRICVSDGSFCFCLLFLFLFRKIFATTPPQDGQASRCGRTLRGSTFQYHNFPKDCFCFCFCFCLLFSVCLSDRCFWFLRLTVLSVDIVEVKLHQRYFYSARVKFYLRSLVFTYRW